MTARISSKIKELKMVNDEKKLLEKKLNEQRNIIIDLMNKHNLSQIKVTNQKSTISVFNLMKKEINDDNNDSIEVLYHNSSVPHSTESVPHPTESL